MQTLSARNVLIVLLCCGSAAIAAGCGGAHSAQQNEGRSPSEVVHPATYDTVYAMDAVDQEPEPQGGMPALVRRMIYPEAAKRSRITGQVMVQFVVAPNGQATNIHVTESVHPILDHEALRVIRESPFMPGMLDGRAVPVRMQLPLSFNMR